MILGRIAVGVAGGFGGTLALLGLRTGSQALWPETVPDLKEDPGEFIVRKVIQRLPFKPPTVVRTALAQSLALGYGLTAGGVYAALRRRPENVVTDGIALGVATWAAGYLGWLPALGLMKPAWQQRRAEVMGPLIRHAAYGCVAVSVCNSLGRILK